MFQSEQSLLDKSEVELEIADLCRQRQDIEDKLGRVRGGYKRIRAQERRVRGV
jgi:hypothetical protein